MVICFFDLAVIQQFLRPTWKNAPATENPDDVAMSDGHDENPFVSS